MALKFGSSAVRTGINRALLIASVDREDFSSEAEYRPADLEIDGTYVLTKEDVAEYLEEGHNFAFVGQDATGVLIWTYLGRGEREEIYCPQEPVPAEEDVIEPTLDDVITADDELTQQDYEIPEELDDQEHDLLSNGIDMRYLTQALKGIGIGQSKDPFVAIAEANVEADIDKDFYKGKLSVLISNPKKSK